MEAVFIFILALSRPSAAVTDDPDKQFQSAQRFFPAPNGARRQTIARSLFKISGWGPTRPYLSRSSYLFPSETAKFKLATWMHN